MSDQAQGLHFQRRHLLHPSDGTVGSDPAFRHALKVALLLRAHLTILHVDPTAMPEEINDVPHVRPTLARWGLLPPDSPRERVQDLGLHVQKVRTVSADPAQSILHHLQAHPADLLVLGTHRREGLSRWLHRPIAEPVARQSHTPTLFVPEDIEGFVAAHNGTVGLRRVLIPAAQSDTTQLAADAVHTLGTLLRCERLDIHLMHVDDTHLIPTFRPSEEPGWTWQATRYRGDVVPAILKAEAELEVDLIVMATEGHQDWGDALLGSTTEQVLREARCPVLAVPAV